MKKLISLIICTVLVLLTFTSCSEKTPQTAEAPKLDITYDAAYLTYDSSAVSAYENVCKAVLNGEESVRLNLGLSEGVNRLFYTSFPLNVLVDTINPSKNGEGFAIKYKLSEEEHKKAVEEFTNKINEIKAECSSNNKNIYALNVYHYVASHCKLSGDSAISCYDTIMKGEGTSFTYAQMLSYLFLQGGIPSCYVTAKDALDAGWGLVQAKLGDNWYYFDPLGEFYDNGGEKLMFFGMTEKDIKKTGLTEPTYSDNSVCADSSSLYFDALRICKSYEIKDNNLLVTTTEDNVVQIAL